MNPSLKHRKLKHHKLKGEGIRRRGWGFLGGTLRNGGKYFVGLSLVGFTSEWSVGEGNQFRFRVLFLIFSVRGGAECMSRHRE